VETDDDDLGAVQVGVEIGIHIGVGGQVEQVVGAHGREAVGQVRERGVQREQVGVGVREDQEAGAGARGSAAVVLDGQPVRPSLPVEVRELTVGKRGRWREIRLGGDHLLDVVVDREHGRLVVDRVEEDRAAVVDQLDDVGEGARSQATADREVDGVAQAPAFPLAVVQLGGDGSVTTLRVATASAGADEQLALLTEHIDHLAVCPDHHVTHERLQPCAREKPAGVRVAGGHEAVGRPGSRGRAVDRVAAGALALPRAGSQLRVSAGFAPASPAHRDKGSIAQRAGEAQPFGLDSASHRRCGSSASETTGPARRVTGAQCYRVTFQRRPRCRGTTDQSRRRTDRQRGSNSGVTPLISLDWCFTPL
jgi:hypothetical protein